MNKEDIEKHQSYPFMQAYKPQVRIDEKYKDKWYSSKHTKLQETENQY